MPGSTVRAKVSKGIRGTTAPVSERQQLALLMQMTSDDNQGTLQPVINGFNQPVNLSIVSILIFNFAWGASDLMTYISYFLSIIKLIIIFHSEVSRMLTRIF